MSGPASAGRLHIVGVGPGDPELLTRKALRLIHAADVVAYHAARHGRSNARTIVADELRAEQVELPLLFPITTEPAEHPGGYDAALQAFYDASAEAIAAHLERGLDVVLLCEGDPFFYGSSMYLHDRLASRFTTDVVPGVTSVSAAAARLGMPLVRREASLTVLPGTLPEDELVMRLADGGAYAIMKLGRTFTRVRSALRRAGVADRAWYVERATMHDERVRALEDVDPTSVPYFALVLVPSTPPREARSASARAAGEVCVVGLGPGAAEWTSPEALQALREATDLVGYGPYLERVPVTAGQRRHASDNRVEIERARHALTLASDGRRVCVVSSGDPGIFAMATAVMEAVEHGPASWRELALRVVPGISAMQAAAARVGAPLGHDFCVISLSDRLKPWEVIAHRLDAAARADLALALYNPTSSQRPWQLAQTRDVLLRHRAPSTPVILARDVGGRGERVLVTELGSFDPAEADMRTIVIVGSSMTRCFERADGRRLVYTPRSYDATVPVERGSHAAPRANASADEP